MSKAQFEVIAGLRIELEQAQKRIAELEEQHAPIPGVTDGTRDSEPYTLDDVAAIEAQRGKPYTRLRATVAERDALKAQVAALRGVCVDLRNACALAECFEGPVCMHVAVAPFFDAATALLATPNPAEGHTLVADETLRRVREAHEEVKP